MEIDSTTVSMKSESTRDKKVSENNFCRSIMKPLLLRNLPK